MQALLFCGEFVLHIPCWLLFLIWGVSLTHPVLVSFLCGSFSYTSRADCFMRGVCLRHPVLYWFLWKEFLLHIPCWLHYCFNLGSFSCTSRGSFTFIWGVSLTHPMLPLLLFLFVLIFLNWGVSLTHHVLASSIIWGVCLTHPVLASFLSGKFLLHIPCWLHFYLGSFSYTSRAGFKFYLGCFSYTSRAGFILSG